jgi:hypothetical protein
MLLKDGRGDYSLVFSATLQARVGGQIDLQLARLLGDELLIDLGVSGGRFLQRRLARSDGWGLLAPVASTELDGLTIDLGRLAEESLTRLLDGKEALFSADARISLARFRVHLDRAGDAGDRAIEQAWKGDARLLAALAAIDHPGVTAELDLLRSGLARTSYAGADLLAMASYAKEDDGGEVVLQTPEGPRTLGLARALRDRGWFLSPRGSARIGLYGINSDEQTETNLLLQVVDARRAMSRDQLLDHVDGLILALAGQDALGAVAGPGDRLESLVAQSCDPHATVFDPCAVDVLDRAEVVSLRAEGAAALKAQIAGLDPGVRTLVGDLGDLRLTAQATFEPDREMVGPPTTVTAALRIDDASLSLLFDDAAPARFQRAFADYLAVATAARPSQSPLTVQAPPEVKLETLQAIFLGAADRYRGALAAERAQLSGLGTLGLKALEVLLPAKSADRPLEVPYESALARSLPQARMSAVTALFDALTAAMPQDLGTPPEQAVGYALLALVQPGHRDVHLGLAVTLHDTILGQSYAAYRKAGYDRYTRYDATASEPSARPISGGEFSLDARIAPDPPAP